MNPKLKYGLIIGCGSLTLLGAGAGATVGILLPKVNQLQKGLGNFFTEDAGYDTYKNFANKKLYYVALGDSITSGYNELARKEQYSFADFLANNLKKSDRLAAYKNYGATYATIYDLFAKVLGDAEKLHVLKKADMISITIGSNDIIRASKFLEVSITGEHPTEFAKRIINPPKIANEFRGDLNINANLQDPNLVDGKLYDVGHAESTITKGERNKLFRKSIRKFIKMYKDKSFHDLITLRASLKDKAFNLVRRSLSILIRDLHKINPNAKILFIAPYFPFEHLPKAVMLKKSKEIQMSAQDIYRKLITTMKESVEFSLDGKKNKFVDFIDVNNLPITKTNSASENDPRDYQNKTFKDYFKKQPSFESLNGKDKNFIPKYWKRNILSNAADVHPSIFGHQLIGNALFSRIYSHLKVKKGKSEDYYTFSKPYDNNILRVGKQDPWTRLDEAPGTFNLHQQYLATNLFQNKGNVLYSFAKILEPFIDKLGLKNSDYKDNIERLQFLRYDHYLPILEMLDEDYIINVLIAIFDKKDELFEITKRIINAKASSSATSIRINSFDLTRIQDIFNDMNNLKSDGTEDPKIKLQKEKQRLNAKLQKTMEIFKKNIKDEKIQNIVWSIFSFLINPGPVTAFILKNSAIGINATIDLNAKFDFWSNKK